MWRENTLLAGSNLIHLTRVCFPAMLGWCLLMVSARAAEEILESPQTFLVVADSTSLMAGDEAKSTIPLGTVVSVTRIQGNWRYCPEKTGWIHIRDLIPLSDAVATFTKEIEDKPTTRACQLRGIAYMEQGEWARAAMDFERAYDLGESAIAVHLNLGTCYERMGKTASAIAEYDAILRTYPDDFSANVARGNLLLQEGQFQSALRDLTRATSENPNAPEAWNSHGIALRMLGRYEDAIESYSKSIERDPNAADALSNRAYAYKQLGKLPEALRDYQAAVQLAPTSLGIRNDLAWFLATTSDPELRDSTRAIEISEAVCEESGNKNGEYLDTLAAAYAAAGRYPAAVEAVRLALNVLGDHPGAAKIKERLALYRKQQPYVEVLEVKPELPSPESLPGSDDSQQ